MKSLFIVMSLLFTLHVNLLSLYWCLPLCPTGSQQPLIAMNTIKPNIHWLHIIHYHTFP